MPMNLSERQQATMAAALTLLSTFVILVAVAALFWIVGSFLRAFSNVFLPIAVAGVAALVFQPFYEWLNERLHLPAPVAIGMVVLSMIVPLAAFFWFFGAVIVDQLSDLFSRVPEWWQSVVAAVEERWPKVLDYLEHDPFGQRVKAAVEGSQESLLEGLQFLGGKALSAGAGALRGVAGLLSWAVLPVYFAFFLMADPDKFRNLDDYLPFLKAETRRDLLYLVGEFVGILVAFFRGQLLIALLQGLLFAIGFSIAGLRYGFILGLLLGFLNIVPYLGNIVGLGVALPLAIFQEGGGLLRLLWVMVVFVAVQMIEGYLLTPKIMGDRTGLHPIVIIVAIFFWGTALDGIMGMILAIPLTAFLVVFWRLAREKYLPELV